jgi:UDP-glucose 4-epimerase
MNIVITGAAGLLGSHLSRHLLDKGHNVIGIDNFFGGYKDFLPEHENFYFRELDLENNTNDLKSIFECYKPEVVYHFAAYAAEGLSPFIRNFNYTNNVLASVNIINECIKYNSKIIFTSSMAVYGEQPPPFTEDLLQKPVDPYGIAKYAVEMDIKQAHDQFGLRYTIVRPHNVLGIYQNIWDKYRNVIGIFIKKVLNDEPIFVYGDGEQTRAFSDIKYYMDPFEKLINEGDSEIFNIGADKYYTINEVANLVKKIAKEKINKDVIIEHKEPRHEVKHAYSDHTKAINLLDFKDDTNIEELIQNMFTWASTQPDRESKQMEYEVSEGIYEYSQK